MDRAFAEAIRAPDDGIIIADCQPRYVRSLALRKGGNAPPARKRRHGLLAVATMKAETLWRYARGYKQFSK
jgi:hypothetical protein